MNIYANRSEDDIVCNICVFINVRNMPFAQLPLNVGLRVKLRN